MAVCKRLLWLTLSVCLVVAAACAGTASAARPLKTGFELPPTSNTSAHLDWWYQKADDTKVQFVRIIVYWNEIETSPGNYNFPAALDNRVDRAINATPKLEPFLTVWKAPSFHEGSGCGSTANPGTCDPDPAAYGALATALANHYKGKVRYWEVWNEPDLLYFLRPQIRNGTWYSPGLYRRLLNQFASNVHAVDPSATVVAGSEAPFKHKPTQLGPLPFMRRVLCLTSRNKPACRAKSRMDAWSVHPYTAGGPRHHARAASDVSLGDLPEVRRVLRAAVAAHHVVTQKSAVGFWVGEFGWDTNGPDPLTVPLNLHARWISEALYQAWRSGVSVFIMHQLRDRPLPQFAYQSGFFFCGIADTSDDGGCEGSGFDYANSAQKPSWQALYFPFVAYAGNGRLRLWGRVPGAAASKGVVIERKTSSGWSKVTTATSNGVGIFAKTIRYSHTRGLLRARVVATGDVSLAFSLVRPRPKHFVPGLGLVEYDSYVDPFGCGGTTSCPGL